MLESPTPLEPADPSQADCARHPAAAVEIESIGGQPAITEAEPEPIEPAARASLGMATAGFIFALTGMLSPVGLVVCILALVRSRREPDRYGGRSLAITGIIAAVLAIALAVFLFILFWNGYIAPASPPKDG